jgi:hypothetical protein
MDRDSSVVDSQLGHWWLPAQPNERIPGSLLTLGNGRQVVRLIRLLPGAAERMSATERYPIVHAQLVSGQTLSLLDSTAVASFGTPEWIQSLYPESTIEGGHLSSSEEPFDGATIKLPHLKEWLGSFIKQNSDSPPELEGANQQVTIKVPDTGAVSFGETMQIRVDARGRVETRDVGIFIQLDKPAPKTRVDEVVRAVQDMVTFFTGIANPLVRYELTKPLDHVPPRWRVLEWSEYSKPDYSAPTHHWSAMVVRADDQLFDSKTVVPKWFEIHREAAASLNQILAFTYVPAAFVDVHFLSLVYGLEGLHRKFELAPGPLTSAARARIEDATAKLNSRTRGLLKNLLKRATEPTLEQRLIGVGEVAGTAMTPLLATFPNYARRIADARNVMAHQLNKESPITSAELADVVEMLQFLAEAYLMRKLGWTEDQVKFVFFGRADYQSFVSYRGGRFFRSQ